MTNPTVRESMLARQQAREERNRAELLPLGLLSSYEARRDGLRNDRALERDPEVTKALYLGERLKTPPRAFMLDPSGHRFRQESRWRFLAMDPSTGRITLAAEGLLSLARQNSRLLSPSQAYALVDTLQRPCAEGMVARRVLCLNPIHFADPYDEPLVCERCGRIVTLSFDGERLSAYEPCRFTGRAEVAFDLDIPSGRLCIGPDLDDGFDVRGWPDAVDRDPPHLGWIEQLTHAYAELGCGICWLDGREVAWSATAQPGQFVIGPVPARKAGSRAKGERRALSLPFTQGELACADADLVRTRWRGRAEAMLAWKEIRVPPGRYRVIQDLDALREGSGPAIRFKRTGDALVLPTPHVARTAGQVLHALDRKHYGFGARRNAEWLLCKRGDPKASSWHPEGHPRPFLDLPPTEPSVPLPVFDRMLTDGIFPESPVYRIAQGTLPANPSFADLARRLLVGLITHGVMRTEHEFSRAHCEAQQALARDLLIQLDARYPTRP